MDNRKIIWKRIVAYAIDILLISLLVSMFSSVKALNPKLDTYNKKYQEYITLTEDYQDKKISQKKYEKQYYKIYYDLQKNYIYTDIIHIVAIFLYFGAFQYITKGQTIGKKLMKLRLVSKDDKDVTLLKCILRSIFLYSVLYYFFLGIGTFFLTSGIYSQYSMVLYYLNMVLEIVIIYLVFTKKDMKGLHDLVAGTKVISLEEQGEPTSIEETKEIEKKVPSKTTTKKTSSKPKKQVSKSTKTKTTTKKTV